MRIFASTLILLVTFATTTDANSDVGVGFKAGTLGIGVEGRWSPLPWLDVRLGGNRYDYDGSDSYAGIEYDAVFAMDNYYLTGNFRFPLSPFRVTAGAFANNNELQMTSKDSEGIDFVFAGQNYSSSDFGALQSTTTFDERSPYLGVGYDFEIFGKVGLNLDFGVLWQGEPAVDLAFTGLDSVPVDLQGQLLDALELERQELEDDVSDYKAWPVISLGFVYNF